MAKFRDEKQLLASIDKKLLEEFNKAWYLNRARGKNENKKEAIARALKLYIEESKKGEK